MAAASLNNWLVTVIGGGGFVGRYVVQDLLRAGARVRVAERDPRRAWYLKPLGGLGQMQFVGADVTRPDTLSRALRGSDAIVNLAGSFADMDAIQHRGAGAVASAATEAGARALVHMSAIGADPDSASTYGRSKGEGEAAVLAAFGGATILRPSVQFGREDAFINRFARLIQAAPAVPVLRAPARFQPVFVGDVATVVTRALADPGRHGGQTYELGGPDIMTMGELMRWIAGQIGRNPGFADLPDAIGGAIARFGFLPGAPITWDQWLMVKTDNVVTGVDGLNAMGVTATPLDAVAPGWLVQYRRHGRFAKPSAA